MFVGSVSDNFDERIEEKIFHSEIVVDNDKVTSETKIVISFIQLTILLSLIPK